ncbi:hypothetical protein I5P86_21375 [Pseudomonas glycinae]|uniref:hypothetical protein n=1 Tax=Pseudomonas TaxID=286 RepID=UPI0018DA3645|nr:MULTISPECIES: hypothetical protein [Pseudomonas]MBH3407612.1 hypothetical protein [Pseudomonas glycinae]MDI3398411.1 hypothetical protein [Pseudomonas sp. V88_4]
MSEIENTTSHQQTSPPVLEGLASFKVKFDAGDSTSIKSLYGNGRMQVKVQVLVSGVDANGDAMHVPEDVINSIELIHYSTGRTLRDGWAASTEQGRYTLEAQTSAAISVDHDDDAESDSVHPQVRTFWVSSSVAGTTRIAARLSLNGLRVLSNGTTLSSVHDSSVTIESQTPAAYAIEQFRWYQARRGNEQPGNRIFNYYLGLYPQGQQIKLVDWIADGAEAGEDYAFAGGNKLEESSTNFMLATFVRPERNTLDVQLPFNGDPIAFLFSEAVTRESKKYSVRVNDHDGELTVVQALSEYSELAPSSRYGEVLHFRAIDQHGTEHKLAFRLDFYTRNFTLERG